MDSDASQQDKNLTKIQGRFSPVVILLITIGGIAVAEIIAMIFVYFQRDLPYYQQVLIDAVIMTVIIFPILYFLSFKPILNHIEERRQAENQIREMALFPTLNPDAVLQVDVSGQIVKANPAGTKMGLIAGSKLFERIPDLGNVDLAGCISEGRTQQIQQTQLDDRVLQWVIHGAPELGLAFLYSTDVTEQKRAEIEIYRLSSIVEQTADTVVVTNRDGFIEYVNPAFERQTGYSKEDVLGHTPKVLKSGLHDERFYKTLWESILAGEVFSAEITNRTKNGELLHEVKTITPLRDARGNITHFVATGKDITERKEAEEKLRKAHDELELRVQQRTEELVAANVELTEEIRERERIEAQLTATMSRLEAHIDNSPLAVIEFDPDFRVIRWSAEAERMFGWRAEEVIGRSIAELDWVYEEDAQSVLQVEEDMISGKRPRNMNANRNYHKDRRVIHCEWYSSAIYNAEGQLTSIQAQVLDVTNRNRMEKALRESEEKFRSSFANAAIGFAMTTPDGHFLDANPAYCSLTGYDIDELLTLGFPSIIHPDDHAENMRLIDQMLNGQIADFVVENRYLRKSGESVWVRKSVSLVRSAAGLPQWIIALVEDITKRKQMEDALRLSEMELRNAQEVARIGNWKWNIEKGEITWSDEMYRIFGIDKDSYTGRLGDAVSKVVHPDDLHIVLPSNARSLADNKPFEYRVILPDQSIRHIWAKSGEAIVDKNGKPIFLTGIAQDITERKQAEQELYKLNRTLKALSDSNQIMMRAVSETEYLDQVCKIVVNDCGHLMVWIGYAEDDENKSVRPVASAGFEAGYLETLKVTWADSERGQGPTGTAIRTGKPSRCRNMLTDPKFEPWRAEALKRGYASSIVLPLMFEGKAHGALTIYSKEPDPFSEDEERLLSELANDLAYGVTSIRLRQALAETAESLRLSDERFRLALKNAPVTVATQDKDLRFTWAYNQRTVDPSMVVGKTDTDLFPPEFASRLMALKRKVLETGSEVKEQMWVSSGSHNLYLEIYLEPIRDSAGQIMGVGIATVDLTERKQAEEALRAARDELDLRVQERTKELAVANRDLLNEIAERKEVERQLRIQTAAMEAAASGIMITDPQGRILWSNPALTRMSGYSENELLGQSTRIFNSGNHDPDFYRELWSTILAGNVWKGETTNRRKDGSQYIEGQTITPVRSENGKISHFIAIKEDITERKRIEAEIQERNRKEKSLMQMVHTMQVDIARDLHDTIGQNIGYLRMKLDYMMEKDLSAKGAELKSEFGQMSQVANESYDLVRGTLAILQSQSPDDLLQLFKRYASQIVERSGLEIEFSDHGEAGAISTHQMRQLFYIFREALSNIEKYSGASHARVDMKWGADTVELSISDNGKGFDPSQSMTLNGHYGLKFMRERTELMNGSFQVKAELGRGTQIIVNVPIQRNGIEN